MAGLVKATLLYMTVVNVLGSKGTPQRNGCRCTLFRWPIRSTISEKRDAWKPSIRYWVFPKSMRYSDLI